MHVRTDTRYEVLRGSYDPISDPVPIPANGGISKIGVFSIYSASSFSDLSSDSLGLNSNKDKQYPTIGQ